MIEFLIIALTEVQVDKLIDSFEYLTSCIGVACVIAAASGCWGKQN